MTREKAIKMLKSKMDGHTDTSYEWAETVRMAIEALGQEPRWIPVSERLPEDRELVLCSIKMGKVVYCRYFDDNTDCRWYESYSDSFIRNNDVNAWMPLPQPYKAESEE